MCRPHRRSPSRSDLRLEKHRHIGSARSSGHSKGDESRKEDDSSRDLRRSEPESAKASSPHRRHKEADGRSGIVSPRRSPRRGSNQPSSEGATPSGKGRQSASKQDRDRVTEDSATNGHISVPRQADNTLEVIKLDLKRLAKLLVVSQGMRYNTPPLGLYSAAGRARNCPLSTCWCRKPDEFCANLKIGLQKLQQLKTALDKVQQTPLSTLSFLTVIKIMFTLACGNPIC